MSYAKNFFGKLCQFGSLLSKNNCCFGSRLSLVPNPILLRLTLPDNTYTLGVTFLRYFLKFLSKKGTALKGNICDFLSKKALWQKKARPVYLISQTFSVEARPDTYCVSGTNS